MEILHQLFENLNKNKIRYAVLRGYESLPYQISHDIDFGVHPSDISKCREIILEVMSKKGFFIVQTSNRQGFSQDYYFSKNECIKFDFWTDFKFRGLRYLNISRILETRILYNGLYVLDSKEAATISFLKELLHNGRMRKDKIDNLKKDILIHGFVNHEDYFIGTKNVKNYITKLKKGDLIFQAEKKALFLMLLKKNITVEGLFKTLLSIFSYFYLYFANFFYKRNFLLALIGPDGSGKTTVAESLAHNIKKKKSSFTDYSYIHGRWGYIPNLGFFIGRDKQKTNFMDHEVKENNTVIYSKIKLMIVLSYYYIDYLLGAIKIFICRGKNKLYIADRFHYDYFISDQFQNYPKFFRFLYTKTLPCPDLVIYLKAEPEIIINRKPELSIDQIEFQQEKIGELATSIKNIASIDTLNRHESFCDIDELINSMRNI